MAEVCGDGVAVQRGHGAGGSQAVLWAERDGKQSLAVGDATDADERPGVSPHPLARTIADLTDCDKIETPHLAEAIQYRPRRVL